MLRERHVIASPDREDLAHLAFTDRRGGYSAAPFDFNLARHVGDDPEHVEQNRLLLASALDCGLDDLVFAHQVHGSDVAVVGRGGGAGDELADPHRRVDALVTAEPGLRLCVLTADCAPVLLADPRAGVIAAAHAGRPGMLAGVVARTVETMRDLGAQAISAVIGPTVCGRCYEVPAAMRAEAQAIEPVSATTTWWGTPGIDVAAGVAEQLSRLGVSVSSSHDCTMEEPALFSYRREGTTGRLAGIIWR